MIAIRMDPSRFVRTFVRPGGASCAVVRDECSMAPCARERMAARPRFMAGNPGASPRGRAMLERRAGSRRADETLLARAPHVGGGSRALPGARPVAVRSVV